jgi:hypothetical protein
LEGDLERSGTGRFSKVMLPMLCKTTDGLSFLKIVSDMIGMDWMVE